MNVSENVMLRLDTRGEVFVVVWLSGISLAILFVPLSDTLSHLGIEITIGIKKVQTLIHINNNMEKQFHAASCSESCRNHRNAKQFTQLSIVYIVASFLGLVKHIKCAHHTKVHVYELGGEI